MISTEKLIDLGLLTEIADIESDDSLTIDQKLLLSNRLSEKLAETPPPE
jgi:hypothetical protein